jgi:hypothetical protein
MTLAARSIGAVALALTLAAFGCASPSSEDDGEASASTASRGSEQAIVDSAAGSLANPGEYIGSMPATLEGGTANWVLYGPRAGDGSLNSVSARMVDEQGKLIVATSFTLRVSDGRVVAAGVNTAAGTPWSLEQVEQTLVRDAEAALAASEPSTGEGDIGMRSEATRKKINCIRASLMAIGIGGGSVFGASVGLASAGGATCIPTMGAGCAVAAVGLVLATATLGAFTLDAYLSCTAE